MATFHAFTLNGPKYNTTTLLKEIEHFNTRDADRDIGGLRYLWRAVIAQALIDALNRSEKMVNKIERGRAIAWFSLHNKDFLVVCAYADLEPTYVIEKVKTALQQGRRA